MKAYIPEQTPEQIAQQELRTAESQLSGTWLLAEDQKVAWILNYWGEFIQLYNNATVQGNGKWAVFNQSSSDIKVDFTMKPGSLYFNRTIIKGDKEAVEYYEIVSLTQDALTIKYIPSPRRNQMSGDGILSFIKENN